MPILLYRVAEYKKTKMTAKILGRDWFTYRETVDLNLVLLRLVGSGPIFGVSTSFSRRLLAEDLDLTSSFQQTERGPWVERFAEKDVGALLSG